jgi:NAD(P)-dependent dehydrogenase (short-subunit alcohol dehydrogenase family)
MIASILDADEFAGRVCVVTGAARGIGAAIAESLARLGGRVIVADINLEGAAERSEILAREGLDATPWRLDVGDAAGIEELVRGVTERLGPPTVLINNAGIVTVAPSVQLAEDEWRRQVDVMLTGTFLTTQAVARSMLAGKGGAIVNLSSIGALGGHPGRSAYNAAKAGISCLTQVLGVEWATRGIRVNAVAPAVTRTEMLEHVLRTLEGATKRAEYAQRTPMGRVAEPEEIAGCVAFLASGKASFITGTTLLIDGGWMASTGIPAEAGS